MNCNEIQNQLLLNGRDALSPAARQHIRECRQCMAFEKTWRLVLTNAFADEPHGRLDKVILDAAAQGVPLHTTQRRAVRLWLLSRGPRIAAAAAVVTLLVWTLRFQVFTSTDSPGPCTEKRVAMITATEKTHGSAWNDVRVDDNLLAIETALAVMEEPGIEDSSTVSAVTDTDPGATFGNKSSIDEAIQHLDADIFFEQEGIRGSETLPADTPRAGIGSMGVAPWA